MRQDDTPERTWRRKLRDLVQEPLFIEGAVIGFLVFSWAASMGYVAGYRDGRDAR